MVLRCGRRDTAGHFFGGFQDEGVSARASRLFEQTGIGGCPLWRRKRQFTQVAAQQSEMVLIVNTAIPAEAVDLALAC
jgi:hypothetical protein